MPEYLSLAIEIDKLGRQLATWRAGGILSPTEISESFDAACARIRTQTGSAHLEWVADRLHDLAYEAGMAEVDSSVLRMVRAGLISADEILALAESTPESQDPAVSFFNCLPGGRKAAFAF